MRELRCLVSGASSVDAHHVEGGSVRRDWLPCPAHEAGGCPTCGDLGAVGNLVPLSRWYHSLGPESAHALGSPARFLEVHGVDLAEEARAIGLASGLAPPPPPG